MKIGQAFNPTRQACGFFPQDIVSRLPRLTILATRRRLSHAHKNIYALLVRMWAKNQDCCPDYKWLAGAVGVSLRSVKMLVEDLEAFGLIRHTLRLGREKGGRHLTNEYLFLWHPIFEVQNPSSVKCKQSGFEVQNPVGLKCKNQHALYSEEFILTLWFNIIDTRASESRRPMMMLPKRTNGKCSRRSNGE